MMRYRASYVTVRDAERRRLDHEAARAFIEAVPPGPLRDCLVEEYVEAVRRGYCLRQLLFGFLAERFTGMAYGLLAEPMRTQPPGVLHGEV